MSRLHLSGAVAWVMSVAACGAGDDAAMPPPDTRAPDPLPKVAHVVAYSAQTETREGPGPRVASIDATIGRRLPPWVLGANNCAEPVATEGACTLHHCFPDWTKPTYAAVYPSAGVIRVRATSGIDLTMSPFPSDRSYAGRSDDARTFLAGDLLSVEASGHDVPAFTATTTFPGSFALTAPIDGGEVRRGAPLTVDWQPRDAGVEVALIGDRVGASPSCTGDDPCDAVVHCSFDPGDAAEIPASMIGDFAQGGRLVVNAANVARQRIGSYDVRFVALGDRTERAVYVR